MNELERYEGGAAASAFRLLPLPGETFQQQLRRVREQLKESLHGKQHPLDQHPLDRNHG